jgi:hypothetical protein
MALHDWYDPAGWDGVRLMWMTEIARDLKARLPAGYRVLIDAYPPVGGPPSRDESDDTTADNLPEPDYSVEVATLEEDVTITVQRKGFAVAAIELISPRNKDRPASRRSCGRRYTDYLRNGVNLLIIDVHRRPALFSFPQYVAMSLRMGEPMLLAPSAVSFGLSYPAPSGGRMVDVWQRALVVGQPLPAMTLMLSGNDHVSVNLDATYNRAAADSYLE